MIAHPARPANRYSPPLSAAALASGLSYVWLQLPAAGDWLRSWRLQADAFVSAWIFLFVGAMAALWGLQAIGTGLLQLKRAGTRGRLTPAAGPAPVRRRLPWWWAALLLAICTAELLTHAGERNGFLASSRPESGVETWTNADGYATLLDGVPAQGDGLFLLSLLKLFLGEGPPGAGEFDRRAGHLFLVSLLQRPFGTYWAFAVTNLVSWWAATMALWWLGQRRWPGTLVPWIASLLAATGLGFTFMAAAPQPHAVAFGAFALVLVLCDRLQLWAARPSPATGAKVGWAIGAAGLIYFVHLPALLFLWLYGLSRSVVSGPWSVVSASRGSQRPEAIGNVRRPLASLPALVVATVVGLAVVAGWQLYGSALLGLSFAGGNNDYAGEAIGGWLHLAARGPVAMLDQLHSGSVRGIFVGAFYYPWWLLAAAGAAGSPRDGRGWALALLVAAAAPAIAFSNRFQLPRLAYFTYPAVYLLAACGVEVLAGTLAGRHALGTTLAAGALTLILVALTNTDLTGWQQFNAWFHYAQGNAW